MTDRFTLLHTNEEVRLRIHALAEQISSDYAFLSEDSPLLVLCTLRGAVFFASDLVRELSVPCELDFIKVHCYQGTRPSGSPIFDLGEQINVRGRHVLIVEDIVDTGRTMDTVMRNFSDKGAVDIRICTMLDKKEARDPDLADQVVPHYVGFPVEKLFVVGWGLDCDNKFRLLPDIMVYHPEADTES